MAHAPEWSVMSRGRLKNVMQVSYAVVLQCFEDHLHYMFFLSLDIMHKPCFGLSLKDSEEAVNTLALEVSRAFGGFCFL